MRKDIEVSIYNKQVEMKKIRDAMAAESKAKSLIGKLDDIGVEEDSTN